MANWLIFLWGFLILSIIGCGQEVETASQHYSNEYLHKIALFAPSGAVRDLKTYKDGAEIIKKHGGKIIHQGPTQRQYSLPYLNGSDEERLAELEHVLFSNNYNIAWLDCGGYGLTRILPLLRVPPNKPQIPTVIGFSDGSALLLHLWANGKRKSIHASTTHRLKYLSADAKKSLWMTLECRAKQIVYPPVEVQSFSNSTNRVEGTVIVSNLSLLNSIIGTISMPDLTGVILILEDVNEASYNVDRMITHLWAAGVLDTLAAVIIGNFAGTSFDVGLIKQIFLSRLEPIGIPLFSGMRVGHINDNWAVPVGVRAQIELEPDSAVAHFKILEEICD